MKCPNCGADVDDKYMFCPSCGKAIKKAESLDMPEMNTDIYYVVKPHKKSGWSKVLLIIILLIAGLAALYFCIPQVRLTVDSKAAELVSRIQGVRPKETFSQAETKARETAVRDTAAGETAPKEEPVKQETAAGETAPKEEPVKQDTAAGETTAKEEPVDTAAGETAPKEEPVKQDTEHKESEDDVRQVQQLLARAGFDYIVDDGKLGPKTKGAIREFRAQAALPEGDYIDQELIDTLTEYVNSPQADTSSNQSVVSGRLVNEDIMRMAEGEMSQRYTLSVGERVQPQASIWNGSVDVSDPAVVSVDGEGVLTALASGTATVVYHGVGDMKEAYTIIVE